MDLKLQECEDESSQPSQNPTTQGSWGHRVHRVQPGDTLDRLAYRYYGDSKVWREIAEDHRRLESLGIDLPASGEPANDAPEEPEEEEDEEKTGNQ